MIIADYFTGLERTLRRNSQVSKLEEPFICLASDNFNGLIRWTLDNRRSDRCLARIDVIHETAPQWGDEHKHLPAVGTVSIGSVPQF